MWILKYNNGIRDIVKPMLESRYQCAHVGNGVCDMANETYMVMPYDCSFVQDYMRNETMFFDSEEKAIDYAIDKTNELIGDCTDWIEYDVFIGFGFGTDFWSLIGYVSYSIDCDEPYSTVEFETCFM